MTSDIIVQEPEKIYLKCEVDFLKFSPEWINIINPFYELFESQIYEWKETRFDVPTSIFLSFNLQKVELGIQDYLNKDECVELSRNENGDRLALSKEQFSDLRRYGEIRVKSVQFPGKNHVWKVNRLFQKGTEETHNDFQKDLSRVLRLVIITMKNRIISKKLSMLSSFNHLWKGFYLFIDLLFGLPHNNPGNIETKMEEECLQFLTCELNVAKSDTDKLSKFWDYLEQLSCLPRQCGAEVLKEYFPLYMDNAALPMGIYQFTTPNRLWLDLRLMNSCLEAKCHDLVQKCINDVEQSNWFLEFKNKYVEQVYHESLSVEAIAKNVVTDGMKTKARRIFDLIKLRCKQESIPESICTLMIDNAKFSIICSEVSEKFQQMWLSFKTERLENIKTTYPFLSMISSWMRTKLNIALKEFLQKHRYTQLKMILDKCASEELRQHEYFVKRYLLFQKERKQMIYHELISNSSFPDRIYEYRSKMIFPSSWKVINPVISHGAKCYEVEKYKSLRWSTQYPLWRWINYFLRTYMLMLTLGQFLLVKLPLKTSISYLSLFCKKPFITKYQFDKSTGALYPSESAKPIPTLYSRLRNLWNNVWKSRSMFENAQFTGLLDKSVARHFNRIWVIGFKGGVGTIGLLIVMPILCLFTSSISVLLGILVPLWVPFVTMAMHVSLVFFYDLESSNQRGNLFFRFFQATLWHIVWCGFLQLYLQITLVVIIFPFLTLLALILTLLRFAIRSCWDILIFHLILKRYAHVPAANDFMTKRVSGPGLAYEYEILVMPEHVLTGLRCLMEKYELDLWLEQVTKIIKQPLENYRSFIDNTLHPLHVSLDKCNKNVTVLIQKEIDALETVNKDYYKRLDMLNISPFTKDEKKERLRMTSKNLKIVLEKSEKMWQRFYLDNIYLRLQQLNCDENSWWSKKDLRTRDMKNLTLSNLSFLFGDQILSPIEECDEVFQLETNELTMKAYVEMFITEEYQNDLDKINIISSNWNQGVSLEYCQFKLRDLYLSHFSTQCHFNQTNLTLPLPLKSCPNNKASKSRFEFFKKSSKWMKGIGKGCNDEALNEEMVALGGSYGISSLCLYHPLIICTLLHLRDRDNAMLHLDHQAVYQGIQNCMCIQYDQEFLENTNMIQSIDYSNNSLDDIYNDGDINNCLLAETC